MLSGPILSTTLGSHGRVPPLWHGKDPPCGEMGRELPRTPPSPHTTVNTFSRGFIGWVNGMQKLAASPHGLMAISAHLSHRNMQISPVDEGSGRNGGPNLQLRGIERCR